MPGCSLRSSPEGSWAQSVAVASFAYDLHFAWGVLTHQLNSRTNLGLAVSGFNAEMPLWAWQVGKSLPREGTPCRYHGHGDWGGWRASREGQHKVWETGNVQEFPGNPEWFWGSFSHSRQGFLGSVTLCFSSLCLWL